MQVEDVLPQPQARTHTNLFHSCFQHLSWYHGEVDHNIAEVMLRHSDEPGTYLLRRRTKMHEGFVISVRLIHSVSHFPVYVTNEKKIVFGIHQFTSVDDFVHHFDNEIVLGTPSGQVSLKRKYNKNVPSPDVYGNIVTESCFPNSAQQGNGIPQISYEGYLTKQGGRVKNWKRRFCKLDGAEFKYFKDIQERNEKKCLDLKTCLGVIWDPSRYGKSPRKFNGGRIFCLVFKERTYHMYGDDEIASEKWKQILEKVLVFLQTHRKTLEHQ
uniref:dual adapter for phosphotyrosine and 3-phosphotyrosine and 3-phosphoinositide-like isoform X1 n=1 Tax=Myxine glutinosa TaxID=7769 RepID=UPI00358FCC0D